MSISDLVLIFRADQKIYIKGSLFNSRRKEGGHSPCTRPCNKNIYKNRIYTDLAR